MERNELPATKRRVKIRSTESNILKELWTPNLFRVLLKDDPSLTSKSNDSSMNEIRFSEIGFPVWSEKWFDFETTKSPQSPPAVAEDRVKRSTRSRTKTQFITDPASSSSSSSAIAIATAAATAAEMSSTWSDPHVLISPELYGKQNTSALANNPTIQPFQVLVHPQVPLLCDLHSHLCDAEIIGFLAGKYDHTKKILYIQACFPCNSLERTEDDGATDVEMDPIAELSVREVISKYDLDVVGWYHSHPLFRPDPSTTDIINQSQYQQLFKHQSYDFEPFVGLIVSTCDPDLPTCESLHQWFHTIPLKTEGIPPVVQSTVKKSSRRKINESENISASIATMYVPMKVEISVAQIKAEHASEGVITSCPLSQISEKLQNKLLQLTKIDFENIDETLPDDECIFIETNSSSRHLSSSNSRPIPVTQCQFNCHSALTMNGKRQENNLSNDMNNGNINHSVVVVVVSESSTSIESNHPQPYPHTHPHCFSDSHSNGNQNQHPQELYLTDSTLSINQQITPACSNIRLSRSRARLKSNPPESLMSLRQPEKTDHESSKKMTQLEKRKLQPKRRESKRQKQKEDPIDQPSVVSSTLNGDEENEASSSQIIDPTSNLSTSTSTLTSIPTSTSITTSTFSQKRIRKESYKKATDGTKLLSRRSTKLATTSSVQVQPKVLPSQVTAISTPPSPSPSPSSSSSFLSSSSSLQFYQYFQLENLSSSTTARLFLCSSPLLLRYSSLCAIALGFYYCSFHRRTNINKRYKSNHKYTKIKYSLMVWIRYFGLDEREQEEYLDNLITLLKTCWYGI